MFDNKFTTRLTKIHNSFLFEVWSKLSTEKRQTNNRKQTHKNWPHIIKFGEKRIVNDQPTPMQ